MLQHRERFPDDLIGPPGVEYRQASRPGLEIDVAIRSHDIPWEWPEAVVDEAGRLEQEPSEEDKKHRIDLRKLPFVTIDGEDARDFDDAVYCEKRRLGGWRLGLRHPQAGRSQAPAGPPRASRAPQAQAQAA